MSLESEVALLTKSTTDLLSAVTVSKVTLDTSVQEAAAHIDSANAAASSAQTARDVAIAQASLAEGHALSAGSVVQQDLSGVTAAALHRSPNAITAMFVYDTSKDSDGGAWTERCQHTSWYNEPINGKWLGAQASEAAARAVSGAATGDYFQRSSDGRFYRLNAGSGITEVFRGNKRDFPRLAGIVAEAANVTIYDLTEPGRPMWMRFGSTGITAISYGLNVGNVNSLAALSGVVSISCGAVVMANFAKDDIRIADWPQYRLAGVELNNRTVAARNSVGGFTTGKSGLVISWISNAVAMTVLPNAPVDPVTGLKVPTIAVATNGGGVSVIKHDGTVATPIASGYRSGVTYDDKQYLWVTGVGNNWEIQQLSPSLAITNNYQNYHFERPVLFNHNGNDGGNQWLISSGRIKRIRMSGNSRVVTGLRAAESVKSRGVTNFIANTYNTGHLIGDIRRAYLADVDAGSVTGPELVTNGTFDTDTSGWTKSGNGVIEVVGGRLRITGGDGSSWTDAVQVITTVVGKSYRVYVDGYAGTANTPFRMSPGNAVQIGAGNVTTFTATAATTEIRLRAANNGGYTTGYVEFDNISVQEAVTDRSYKAKPASITGTLTKSPVASNSQLVAYSGFSATDYLREPYSADLDFGTGEWSVGAWVNVPTGNAAAATIASREHSSGAYIRFGIDATNKLTATAFDGTTTRTVTTSAAYNTGTWLNARADYTTDGKLSIKVNGVEVASATGAPLLTLNNSNAVLTIGNSYALDAPFPGSIALLKLSATVPTAEQSVWMYEQEKQLFREGAQCCLPDSGTIVDLAYDDATDKWIAASANNISEWSGLVRTNVTPVPAGSYTKAAAASGVQLLARSTTNPGVDITIPAYGLREELVKRAEAAAQRSKETITFDFDVKAGQTEFALPVGYDTKAVYVDGAAKRQGSTKDYTLLFDGFKETVKFAVAPAAAAWVQIHAIKE